MSNYDCVRLGCPNWAGDGLCNLAIACYGTTITRPACESMNAGFKRPIKDQLCPLGGKLFFKVMRILPKRLFRLFENVVKWYLHCPEQLGCPLQFEEDFDEDDEDYYGEDW